ncbi:MAG: FadR family transcriptional regulator [Lachnospiraceae bacterium]|nr:FadR family transcriptional regulator [Lachnospiraceae bacterium]
MKPIERIPIVEQVMNNLNEYIREQGLASDSKMPTEKEVCEMFGVGRSTVREAYRMMQALGILEVRRGKGVYFISFPDENRQNDVVAWFKQNAQTLSDYMEVRSAIETMAIRLAIERASEKEIAALEKIQASFIQDAAEKKQAGMAFYDQEFHLRIAAITRNGLLIKIEKIISECLIDYRAQTFTIEGNIKRAIVSHRKLIDAFLNRDVSTGVRLMTEHMENSLIDMERIMKQPPRDE